ncbi:MAG: pilus assembly protein PilM [Candidatus Omnitrophica bacterium]|nr:pilus assembly protein PilM [Candidatus Omnitrophota bacterium]
MRIGGRRVLSVDIGSTKIRVCDIESSGHKARINYYDEMTVPVSPEERDDFIRTEGKNFIKSQPSKTFYTSLPGRGVLVRTLAVPRVPIKKLRDILKYEVQQQIPFPLEMVEWKYQILSETPQSYNVLLGAVKKDLISDFLSRLHGLGIDPLFLDTDMFAILNSFVFSSQFSYEKCQAILEIGATSANLIINHKEKLLIRSLTTAGDTLTGAISEADSVSFAEAEGNKIAKGMEIPVVTPNVENLHTEIQNSIDYWRFTQKGPEVEELYICGQSAMLKNFKEFMQEKARINTFYFTPFSNIELDEEYAELKKKELEFAALTGIALRKIGKTFVNLDILPEEIERVREFKHNRPYIYMSVAMAALIALMPALFVTQEKTMLNGMLNEIELSLQQYEKYKPDVDKLRGEISGLEGQVGTIQGVIDEKNVWLKRVLALGSTLPSSRIYIISFYPGQEAPPVSPIGEQAPGMPPPEGPMPPGMPPPEGPMPPDMPPPGAEPPPAEGQQQASGIKVEEEKVFTMNGEIIITDIKTAFNDFKAYVTDLSKLAFMKSVTINSCEVSQGNEKLQFSLLLELQ